MALPDVAAQTIGDLVETKEAAAQRGILNNIEKSSILDMDVIDQADNFIILAPEPQNTRLWVESIDTSVDADDAELLAVSGDTSIDNVNIMSTSSSAVRKELMDDVNLRGSADDDGQLRGKFFQI